MGDTERGASQDAQTGCRREHDVGDLAASAVGQRIGDAEPDPDDQEAQKST